MSFVSLLQDEGTSITIEISGQAAVKFIPLERASLNSGWKTLSEFCSFLSNAFNRLCSDQDVETSLIELEKSLDDNAQMYAAATRPGAKFEFQADKEITIPTETEGHIFLPICIEFAGLVYHAVVKADALPRLIAEKHVSFVGAKPVVIEEAIAPRHDGLHEQLNTLVERLAKDAVRPGLWTVTAKVSRSEGRSEPRKLPRQINPSRRPPLSRPKRGKKSR